MEHVVAVQNHEVGRAHFLHALVACAAGAKPACGNNGEARVTCSEVLRNRRGAVGRPVFHHNNAQRLERLAFKRIKARADAGFHVVRGNNDVNGRVVKLFAQLPRSFQECKRS